ncbi:hypothetical protein CAPTEDRAFT_210930 [Capitella teleta]|uniref:Uncharacterized protein n=1 Tax=Capitella teleta TaxID=283909 RepID=R7VFL9_CAPTE|nr:hypothetical protein CAPTEDRAFT_210930 [Capitella teleta]|eukprot:ELU14475.1 hypothetical protein CAPTEDRAFT_210930 [Capitella teleta]
MTFPKQLAAMLVVTIATTFDLGYSMPLRCELALNPSSKELQKYQMCLRERMLRDDIDNDDDYDNSVNLVDRYDEDALQPSEEKFIDTLANDEVQTFPQCIELLAHECRALLRSLEELTETLRGFSFGRRRKRIAAPQRRSSDTDADSQKLLSIYRQWRTDNGYGNAVGRWGRSEDEKVPRTRMLPDEATNQRAKRSEIDSDDVMALLEEYKRWREEHGYGKSPGRWG